MPIIRSMLVLIMLVLILPASAATAGLSKEQQQFQSAIQAFNAGRNTEYRRLRKALKNSPLSPYLEFSDLKKNMPNFGDRKIRKFIENNQENPLGRRLHQSWLGYLAKNEYWARYRKAWSDQFEDNTRLLCHFVRSQQVRKKDVKEKARDLWLSGRSRPDACNPVFKEMERNGELTSDLVWERYILALEKPNRSLGGYLAKKLPAEQRGWHDWWKKLDRNPVTTLQLLIKEKDNDSLRQFLVYGVKRFSRKDTVASMLMWKNRIKPRFEFSAEQVDDVERSIALRSAWRHELAAQGFLDGLQDSAVNQEVREWRIRSSIRQQNWQDAQKNIGKLDLLEQQKSQWQYWKARALEAKGHTAEAMTIYTALTNETGYYGFLSFEKRGLPLKIKSIAVVSDEEMEEVEVLSREPGFVRARLLKEMKMDVDASREWDMAMNRLNKDGKRYAAKLAEQMGWHFRAIATVAKAGHFSDLELRFPVLYEDLVRKEARRNRIQPGWVYGVIRRESAWREDVVSPAGAIGLMQLMPRTARQMAKKTGMRRPGKRQIKDVNKNIRLGTAYLRQVLDQYGEHEILATASYNAGPHRVKQWLPEDKSMPADIWIDTITFDETRNYVKAVFAYSTIMNWKLGEANRPMSLRLRAVAPLDFYKS